MLASYMMSSEDLDAETSKRGHAAHKNRLALVEDLSRPAKTAVRVCFSFACPFMVLEDKVYHLRSVIDRTAVCSFVRMPTHGTYILGEISVQRD